jgi:uncharacterized protein (DUF1684 family)
MPEYKCSVCDYTSSKFRVIRHINKKKSCGEGTRNLLQFNHDYNNCEHCDKLVCTLPSLNRHL